MWQLKFSTYSGMTMVVEEGERDEVRKAAAQYLRKRRNGYYEISTLDSGKEWEIQSHLNRDGVAITDSDGLLYIVPPKEGEDLDG
jgi:hypothetical protein